MTRISEEHGSIHGTHCALVYKAHKVLEDIRRSGSIKINGDSLDIPAVVAVSKYGVVPYLDNNEEFRSRIEASVAALNQQLYDGKTIYGVTTGFGGSADTRTARTEALQSALLQHHHYGLLTKSDQGKEHLPSSSSSQYSQAMPSDWVRGTMLVRCNTVARGHSAVSIRVIEAILALLKNDFTPVVPLKGSISASGDLSPLSYIAGSITGVPDIYIKTASGVIPADQALRQINLKPIVLGPKEGLGLMNGTATSAAVAGLALYDTHQIMVLSQLLTAMATEALVGTVGSFDPFISEVRPHRGQTESAASIRRFLQGSQLARGLQPDEDARRSTGLLCQDRYALRTSSQWIGPQIEDLLLAHEQVSVELNSTTDNPLVDVTQHATHHGGNFQAAIITSAMEKTRLSLQMIGKLLFAQCSEMINPMLNHGLPPNLAADDPSLSFTMKGLDIGMAAYMSELAYLANPVSSHVQSAEMHNQAVNSLAFISTRYTVQSVDLVSYMSASHLYTVCQAMDLRVLQNTFFQNLEPALRNANHGILGRYLSLADVAEIDTKLWNHVRLTWQSTSSLDMDDRVTHVVNSALGVFTRSIFIHAHVSVSIQEAASTMEAWRLKASAVLSTTYLAARSKFFGHQNTAEYLGLASKKMYLFVRETLGVPFHKGLEDHPTPGAPISADGRKKQTIGSWIGVIYESLCSGELHRVLMECLSDAALVPTDEPLVQKHRNGVKADQHMNGTHLNGHHNANGTTDVFPDTVAGNISFPTEQEHLSAKETRSAAPAHDEVPTNGAKKSCSPAT